MKKPVFQFFSVVYPFKTVRVFYFRLFSFELRMVLGGQV